MPGRNTANFLITLAVTTALGVLPIILIGQQACGKSLNELKNWVHAEPLLIRRMQALPYPVLADSTDRINTTPESGLYPRYFFMGSRAPQAFFCRLEYQLAQKIQVPFKFRLGSVQYVDWLEGKPGAVAY